MEPQIGIYKITNKINGKMYIGQTRHFQKRWAEHKNKAKDPNQTRKLYKAMYQYGIDNFSFEVIECCKIEELNKRELYWIDYYNSIEEGYNMSLIQNTQRKVDYETVKQIQYELEYTKNTNKQIAEQYDVSPTWVTLVSKGILWHNESLEYPLRPVMVYKHEQNYCIDCGQPILHGSKRCVSCSGKAQRVAERPSREELKQLIRTKPFQTIGKMYGVRDNSIRKWCDRYNLPRRKLDINSYSDEEWELI